MVEPADLWTVSVAIKCGQDCRGFVMAWLSPEKRLMICARLEFKFDFLTQLVSRIVLAASTAVIKSQGCVSNTSCLIVRAQEA